MMHSESSIIDFLKTAFPDHIGDDAAVLSPSTNKRLVITNDLLVEDVHFRRRYQTPAELAHKALHVNLSDVAAMGATPQYILLGLSIPESYLNQTDDFLTYFAAACKAHQVQLIGGDTTRSPDKLFISVTAIGFAEKAFLKHRHQAQAGDIVCIAGQLGAAHVGFTALEQEKSGLHDFKQAFLKPQARLNEGVWFGQQSSVTAMMDVSDGLFTDLEKLAKASNLAAYLNLDLLPTQSPLHAACLELNLNPITTQLTGGEDYSLLVTIKTEHYASLAADFKTQFSYALQPVGYLDVGRDVNLIQNGKPTPIQLDVYTHF